MATTGRDIDASDDVCVVCFKNVELYSVGQCDHPVCYECSTRMRVLCQQTECPICRQDMPKVIFTTNVQPFKSVKDHHSMPMDKKYKICFESPKVEKAYRKLLKHSCITCSSKPEFKTFAALKDHNRREHELFFCDLCVDNLKIFSCERRSYTRSELGQHRRRGDPDDRSHRGHPLCEFCDERFMDNDELFRHLRRNHLFCHFCDADGYHRYFGSYDYLREHFRSEHYLCEEGDCQEEKFTSVFRSEIDLKAHRASVHSRSLGKAATKQARTLELEFTLAPRTRGPESGSSRGGRGNRGGQHGPPRRPPTQMEEMEGAVGYDNPYVETKSRVDMNCPEAFPSLGGHPSSAPNVTIRSSQHPRRQRLEMSEENFPALHGGEPEAAPSRPNKLLHFSLNSRPSNNLSIQVNHTRRTVASPSTDFPVLGVPSTPVTSASWKGGVFPSKGSVVVLNKGPYSSKAQDKAPDRSQDRNIQDAEFNAQFKASCSTASKKASSTVTINPSPVPEESCKVSSKSKKKKSKGKANAASPTPPQSLTLDNNKKKKSEPETSFKPLSPTPDVSSIDRKRSELNIGALKEELNSPSTSNTPSNTPSAPPPGFSAKTSAPPGFSVTLNSVARPSNGLTFTNSSGESFQIRQNAGIYLPPVGFEKRNQALVAMVTEALQQPDSSSGGLAKFRQISAQFRQSELAAVEYYQQCQVAMGGITFERVFPELLALLPDIRKQQELWRAHGHEGPLEECPTCGQVLLRSDLSLHLDSHVLDSHFPALAVAALTAPSWPRM